MSEHGVVLIAALVSLVAIELAAILKGINGKLLIVTVAAIAAIAGVSIDRLVGLVSGGG